MSKFSKDGVGVLDTCVDTPATANGSLQLPGHRQFVGYKGNYVCFQNALLSLAIK